MATGKTYYKLEAPYYIVPDVEAYRKLDPTSEEARLLSRKISANIGDLMSLRQILGIDPPEFAKFYPDMETETPSTMDTIDAFLNKFGQNLAPTGYIPEAAIEEREVNTEKPEIHEEEPVSTCVERENKYEESFESLIKKHQYEAALTLIEAENLKNPQKSIYFAHQMRFIKKLIAIENYKNTTQG